MDAAAQIKLSRAEDQVLEILCRCEPGKGMPLDKHMRRYGLALIRKGAAWSLGFGSFEVFVATDEGRALAKATA